MGTVPSKAHLTVLVYYLSVLGRQYIKNASWFSYDRIHYMFTGNKVEILARASVPFSVLPQLFPLPIADDVNVGGARKERRWVRGYRDMHVLVDKCLSTRTYLT